MNCPVCNVALLLADRQGVEIDYCPKCRGIWLDRGELDKIIERSEQLSVGQAAAPVEQRYDDRAYKHHDDHHHDKHGHYDHHRKKSLLRELFD
jgi:uncharacterized protein